MTNLPDPGTSTPRATAALRAAAGVALLCPLLVLPGLALAQGGGT